MKKLCPNLDREDGLETVLEVPIPEEMFDTDNNKNNNTISWHNMKSWMKLSNTDRSQINTVFGSKNAEVQLLLGVIGAPLIPLPIPKDHQPITRTIKDQPIEASMAKYIVKQYIAAVGGEKALNSVESMYAMGKVKMAASEFSTGERSLNSNNNKVKVKSLLRSTGGGGEMGGFVLWQKRPELWCLELVVSGCKSVQGATGKWLGAKLHGTTLMPLEALLVLSGVSFRVLIQGQQPTYSATQFASARKQSTTKTASSSSWKPIPQP